MLPALRQGLPSLRPAAADLASPACVLFDQIKPEGVTVKDYERALAQGHATRLY